MSNMIYIIFAFAIFVLFVQAVDDNRRNPPLGMNGGL